MYYPPPVNDVSLKFHFTGNKHFTSVSVFRYLREISRLRDKYLVTGAIINTCSKQYNQFDLNYAMTVSKGHHVIVSEGSMFQISSEMSLFSHTIVSIETLIFDWLRTKLVKEERKYRLAEMLFCIFRMYKILCIVCRMDNLTIADFYVQMTTSIMLQYKQTFEVEANTMKSNIVILFVSFLWSTGDPERYCYE